MTVYQSDPSTHNAIRVTSITVQVHQDRFIGYVVNTFTRRLNEVWSTDDRRHPHVCLDPHDRTGFSFPEHMMSRVMGSEAEAWTAANQA